MACIIETPNPFEPHYALKHVHPGGVSVRDWIMQHTGDLEIRYVQDVEGKWEFAVPTYIMVNGMGLKRAQWDRIIAPNDIINIIVVPGGPFVVIAALVVAVVALSVVFALTVQVPDTPGELPSSDPVFSFRGQQNQVRSGEPIECCYGRNRIYPSFAAAPWFQYLNNDQYQYSIYCLGQGEFDISEVMIGDTNIDNFPEAEYEVVPPGGTVSIFPSVVYTALEAGGQEIYAPNEPEYVAPGWVGPFPANPSGTLINVIQVDLVFPAGIYRINDQNELRPINVTVEVEYREIDDAGNPVGAGTWVGLVDPPDTSPFVFTAATVTPQRRTLASSSLSPLTPGRYEVRVRQPNPKGLDHKAGNDVIWESLKGFYMTNSMQNWGDVTLIAVAIKATASLNERTQIRFNVVATRKLPIYSETDGWSAPTTTRSIVWAFADVFRAQYGARLADMFLDLDKLIALDLIYEDRNEHFDWIFRDRITVWEAAQTIARVGRALPILQGSLVTLIRDAPASVPVTMFSPDNIVAGSFHWSIKFWEMNEHDSLRIEYTEPSTGYKQETVMCTLGTTTDNPKDVRIPGIQDRAHAYREGLYILSQQAHQRENITWETGLEGYIPTYGDLVLCGHDVPRWSQWGYVVAAEYQTDGDYLLQVSQELDWSEPGSKVMILRGRRSQVLGPYPVVQGDHSQQVLITVGSDDFDFLIGGASEPMIFHFGVTDQFSRYVKVVRIEPQGGEKIKMTAVNYAPEVYENDEEEPDELPDPGDIPGNPTEIEAPAFLYLRQVDSSTPIVQMSWTPVEGALRYKVETSQDGGLSWTDRGEHTTTALLLQMSPGEDASFRVAAITEIGTGPWRTETLTVAALLGLVVLEDFEGLQWRIGWSNLLQAVEWKIRVYDNMDPSNPVLKGEYTKSFERRFTYNYYNEALVDGNLVREHLVEVYPVFLEEEGTPVSHEFSNPIPDAPASPGSSQLSVETDEAIYRLTWNLPADEDLVRIKVWLSDTNNFDPEVVTPVEDITVEFPGSGVPEEVDVSIPLDTAGEHPIYYWRVAVFDVWGNEIATNITAQQSIPAYS